MFAKVKAEALPPQSHRTYSGDLTIDDEDRVYLAAGDVVANKYRVDHVLGVGGVGFVVAATHVELGGLVALKFLKRRFLHDRTIGERFTREAKAASRISSEFVARVYDVGSHDGAPFIVLEHLVGRDLSAVLAERGALELREAADYGVQACAALAAAHANGIVHRDIKPENLFVVDEQGLPTVKLLDFGISKFVLTSGRRADEWPPEEEAITGLLTCGTPDYMSPEQIRSTASVDARSDVWSLGVVLYELIASTPAFLANSIVDTCTAIIETEPERLDHVRPEVPASFADIVARCLQKDPADRFATVAELAIALLPFASSRALAIAENSEWIRRAAIQTIGGVGNDPRVSATPSTVSSVPSVTRPSLVPASSPVPRRRWMGAAIAAAMSVAALAGTYQWIHGGNHTAEARGMRADPTAIPVDEPSRSPGPSLGAVPVSPPVAPSAAPVAPAAAPIRAAMPVTARAMPAPVRPTAKVAPSPASLLVVATPSALSAASPPPAWQTVTPPSARTARSIDSSNPWSTTK
jgi:serine/threonine-protein kinase